MNKFVLLLLVGTLALLTEGCSYFRDFAKARKEIEENTVKPISVQVNTTQKQQNETEEEEEEFADLEEEVEPVQEIAGLIPATDPDARVRRSVRGRNDPFSIVTLKPEIEIEPEEEPESFNANRNSSNNTRQNQSDRQANTNSDNTNLADLPEPPVEPTLAQDVIISGLYVANGRPRLIVQAPEESSSRYVEEGQYLSNGQVLVKNIDLDHFPYPRVILEQSGVEVAKTIGGGWDESDDENLSSLPSQPRNSNWVSSVSLNSK